MWYFANPCTPKVRDAMADHSNHLGMIATPRQGNKIDPRFRHCWDNSVFGEEGYPGDDVYLGLLDQHSEGRSRCVFAVAPDVVGDAAATLERSAPMLLRIRAAGYPVALAAQNGLESLTVPWDSFDAFFIGGDTAWKEGPHARRLAREARRRGKWVHMGRVNSLRRLQLADEFGCHSVDGTYLAFGPDTNLPKVLGWLRFVNRQGVLWEAS